MSRATSQTDKHGQEAHPDREPTGYEYLALDPDYIGSCPCASFELAGTLFDAHCWRVCGQCRYAGLHYEGDPGVARRVKRAFDAMDWSEWSLRKGLRR